MRSLLMIGSTKISTLFPYTTLFRSIRMGVMSTLMVNDQINFNDLKQMLGVTDGNLASHLANLEENGFIKVHKGYIRSEEHTSELQSRLHLVCRLLLEKKKIVDEVLE